MATAAANSSKQSTIQFKPVAKGLKKNPWSDNESLQSDSEMEEEEMVAPRERVGRRAKGEAAQNLWPLSLLIISVRAAVHVKRC